MILIEENGNKYISLKVFGKIRREDYDVLIPFFEDKIEKRGSLYVLCEISEYAGIEMSAIWQDMLFGIKHARDFKLIAVVGAKKWMELCVSFFALFVHCKIKFFPSKEYEEAKFWIARNIVTF